MRAGCEFERERKRNKKASCLPKGVAGMTPEGTHPRHRTPAKADAGSLLFTGRSDNSECADLSGASLKVGGDLVEFPNLLFPLFLRKLLQGDVEDFRELSRRFLLPRRFFISSHARGHPIGHSSTSRNAD